jgi:phosphate transport system substrate-binding protein
VNKTIVVLSRESSSGTHVYFKEHVLRRGNEKGPEEYRNDALFMPSTQAIVDEIAKNDAAIGYIGLGYLEEAGDKIKDVKVNGIEPKIATVKNKTYPISRPLYWYTNGEPKGEIKNLVDYALGAEGKKVILKEGFVPLN